MNKLFKNAINKIIYLIFLFVKSEYKRARVYAFFSKIIFDKQNDVVFDQEHKIYWLKNKSIFLYAVDKPYFNFSMQKLFSYIENIYCKEYIPKKDDIIVDVGAGIGTELVYFRKKIGENGQIHSIEASPSSFLKLNLLSKNNSYLNSSNYNCAISNFNGQIWIEETEDFEKNRINNDSKGFSVNAITFDQFIRNNNISRIDFLKVNIEGAELEMFHEMENSFKIIKNIAVSCHDFLYEEPRQIKKSIVEILEKNDFKVTFNNSGNIITDSWIFASRK